MPWADAAFLRARLPTCARSPGLERPGEARANLFLALSVDTPEAGSKVERQRVGPSTNATEQRALRESVVEPTFTELAFDRHFGDWAKTPALRTLQDDASARFVAHRV